MSNYSNFNQSIKEKLDAISPSFCAAKWLQVTLHLHNGRTHSCHHPRPHLIPLTELKRNVSALHNTEFKKQQRKLMLEGKRPSECQYCWNVEDLPDYKKNEFFSDRVLKSAANWSLPKIDDIKSLGWDADVNPAYVEVSFSNVCNFKCSYCSPVYSSRWTEEIERSGPYPTSGKFNDLTYYRNKNEMPIHHKEYNPYVEAFWKWWPDLVKDLKVFRITGGEPLLSDHTFKVLDYLNENPQPNLELAVNTNACVPDSKIEEFIEKTKQLLNGEQPKIKKMHLFVSIDSAGKQAEYGRFGLDYEQWKNNLKRFLAELPTLRITIMSTTNIFSITNYKELLQLLLEYKRMFISEIRPAALFLDIAILRHPHHQCVSILTDEYKKSMDDCLEFMKQNEGTRELTGFFDYEIAAMERFITFLKSKPNEKEGIDLETARIDFYKFVTEHDSRRGTSFLQTFPELLNFYEHCEKLCSTKHG